MTDWQETTCNRCKSSNTSHEVLHLDYGYPGITVTLCDDCIEAWTEVTISNGMFIEAQQIDRRIAVIEFLGPNHGSADELEAMLSRKQELGVAVYRFAKGWVNV